MFLLICPGLTLCSLAPQSHAVRLDNIITCQSHQFLPLPLLVITPQMPRSPINTPVTLFPGERRRHVVYLGPWLLCSQCLSVCSRTVADNGVYSPIPCPILQRASLG